MTIPRVRHAPQSVRRLNLNPQRVRRALCIACAAGALLVNGCTSVPTPMEIEQQVQTAEDRLIDLVNQEIAKCNGDQACIDGWRQWLRDRLAELNQLRIRALEESWKDARKRREEWEKKIRDMFPSFPDIKELLPWGKSTKVTSDLATGPVGSSGSSSAGGGVGASMATPVPVSWVQSVPVTGSLSLANSEYSVDTVITGNLSISGTTSSNGAINAEVYAGALNATIVGLNSSVVLTVDTEASPANSLTINSAGSGRISIVFARSIPDLAWDAIVPGLIRVSLPVTRHIDGTLHISLSGAVLGQVMPTTPYSTSDYDGNGVLNYTMDYAAFLTAFANKELRADTNCDGYWTQADIDRWDRLFQSDAN
jgi:hypothetical protein